MTDSPHHARAAPPLVPPLVPPLAWAAVFTVPLIAWSRDIAVVTLVLATLGFATRHAEWSGIKRLAAAPAAVAAGLFVAWTAASVLWAPHLPWETWSKTGVLIVFGAGLPLLLATQPGEMVSRAATAALCAALALLGLLVIERATGGALIGLHRDTATVFQRLTTLSGGLVLLCTTCFAVGVLLSRYLGALIAVPLWTLAVLGVALSYPADAGVAAVAAGAAVFALVLAWGVRAAVAVMILLAAGMAGWGFFAEGAAGAGLHHWLIANIDPNWGYRIEIWRYTSELIRSRPLAGHGFDAARVAGESAALMPSFVGKTSFLHPHNGMLQLWLELGLVGVLLFLAAAALGFRAFLRTRPGRMALATASATATTTAVIWSLSFGLWQGWWLAVLGLTAACLTIAVRAQANAGMGNKRLLFLVTELYMFNALKREITEGARREGFEIFVAGRARPEDLGGGDVTVIPFDWKRSPSLAVSMLRFIPDLVRVGRLLNHVNPDLLHNIALKPSVIGALAAMGRGTRVINAIHGFGFLFLRRAPPALVAQAFCGLVLRLSARFNGAMTLLINRHDFALARERMRIPEQSLRLIRGTGIDLSRFAPQPEPGGTFTFLVIGRLLYMKGIDVAVEAHRRLRERGFAAELVICGSPDPGNPSSIPEPVLAAWAGLPGLTLAGQVNDVRPYLAGCHVLVHPSLGGEGLPRALSEAAATERALIATDIPGNTEIVIPNQTGLLVPPGNADALTDAMQWMMEHTAERRALAKSARELITREFSSDAVAEAHAAALRYLATGRG